MSAREDQPEYTIKAAAERASRSTRTIERWLHDGMKARVFRGIIVIAHTDLIEQMIAHNGRNPILRGRFDTPESTS